METPIGHDDTASRRRGVALGLTAAAVVGADLWLVWTGRTSLIGLRTLPPAIVLVFYAVLFRGDLRVMGLRLWPVQGLRYWLKATALIGATIGAFLVLAVTAALLTRYPIRLSVVPPFAIASTLVHMCVLTPIMEEAIYRFGFCTGSVATLRPWGTIAASGLIFGALHVLYGNPAPDNLIAGFFLAWAYLKSGTIVVPVALHSLGNLLALSFQLGTWYWQVGSA